MNELENLIQDIGSRYKLGEPWKYKSGVIVPITCEKPDKRDYVILPEVKDKISIEDTGSISSAKIKGTEKPVFIKSGTTLEGSGTQPRAVEESIIIEPKEQKNVKVRCVEASHSIHSGTKFEPTGITPMGIRSALYTKSQSNVWNSVNRQYTQVAYMARMKGADIGGLQFDNLPKINEASRKINEQFTKILSEVPCLENQIGAVIVGLDGIEGVEMYNHPDSWKAQYKEVIESYSDVFSKEQTLYSINLEKVNDFITSFLEQLTTAQTVKLSATTHSIQFNGYIGEYIIYNGKLIHIFLIKGEKSSEQQNEQTHRSPFIGGVQIGESYPNHTYMRAYGKSKKGMGDIIRNLHSGPKTFGELSTKSNISTATLTSRLKEGIDYGIFEKNLRQDGKRAYKMKQPKHI